MIIPVPHENAKCSCGITYFAGKSDNVSAQQENLRCPACGQIGAFVDVAMLFYDSLNQIDKVLSDK
jgi:hypothetical protein